MKVKTDCALVFATVAHNKQRRKYTDDLYMVHPINVVEILRKAIWFPSDELICAAYLHDVLEDTDTDERYIKMFFGGKVLSIVKELTDVPLSFGNRAARVSENINRLANVSWEAQTIKYADIIDNTKSIVEYDPKFAKVYLEEVQHKLTYMDRGDKKLREIALFDVLEAKKKLESIDTKNKSV